METFTTHYVRTEDGVLFHGSCMVAEVLTRRGYVDVRDKRTAPEENGFTAVKGTDYPHGRCGRCRLTFPDPVLCPVPESADGGVWQSPPLQAVEVDSLPVWEAVEVITIADDDGTSAHAFTVVVSSPSRDVLADYIRETWGDDDAEWFHGYATGHLMQYVGVRPDAAR